VLITISLDTSVRKLVTATILTLRGSFELFSFFISDSLFSAGIMDYIKKIYFNTQFFRNNRVELVFCRSRFKSNCLNLLKDLHLLAVKYRRGVNLLDVMGGFNPLEGGANPPLRTYKQFTHGGDSATMAGMMKASSHAFLSAGMLAMLLLVPLTGPAASGNKAAAMELAATIFPVADIARRIAGPDIRVIQILPAGASPHTFDLTPGKVRELQAARIIFKIGGVDDWIDGIAESLPQASIITLQKGIALKPAHEEGHQHGNAGSGGQVEFDPHYWLSAENGALMAKNIAEALAKADPARAATYRVNLAGYSKELAGLHRELKKDLAGLKTNKMIVFHDAWRYFAAAYGLEIAAVFQASPGREPSPRDLQGLYSRAGKFGIKAIFSEPQLPIASLEPMLEDLGLELVVLDPLGGSAPGDSYVNLLRRNARAIRRALGR
jgi:zinc transport system substrate-binding protein